MAKITHDIGNGWLATFVPTRQGASLSLRNLSTHEVIDLPPESVERLREIFAKAEQGVAA